MMRNVLTAARPRNTGAGKATCTKKPPVLAVYIIGNVKILEIAIT